MYEQHTYIDGNTTIWLPPKHFPVYFYFMAFFAYFGAGEIGIRIITWLTLFPLLFLLRKLTDVKDEQMLILLLMLFFLDPILIEINYIGKFDQFAIMFMIAGIYLMTKERPFEAGFLIALGTLAKFQPFFAYLAGVIVYVRRKQWNAIIKLSISCLGTTLLSLVYLYKTYGEDFTQVIDFQATRKTPNLSFWYYILPDNYSTDLLLVLQLIFYLLIGISSLFLVSHKFDHSLLLITSYLNAAFIIGSSQYYSTYSYFFTLPFIPIFIEYIQNGKLKHLSPFIFSIGFYFLGLLLCYNSCYPTINPFTYISATGITLISISTVSFLYSFIYTSIQDRKESHNLKSAT